MNNKEKIPFGRLGLRRRSLRKNKGRRETNLHFSKIVLKDIHRLESREWLKWGNKVRDRHPFSVGAVKRTTSTEIVPIKMAKQELPIMFNKLKQWRTWAIECQGSMWPWTTRNLNFSHT
jgi:hypothetical protein